MCPTSDRPPLIPLAVLALAAALLATGAAVGGEWRWAGSAQLDYLAVPTSRVPRSTTLDGFTTELSVKVSADITDRLSAGTKVCDGCHGLEVGMAMVDFSIRRDLRLRIGRFTPRFGAFPARHDPANHPTSDKPLPYDMGRMLRLREWNMGVLPAPYVDNGIELAGTHELGTGLDIDWAAYLIGGLKGAADATDFDFIRSRSAQWYYVDNNSRPSAGARTSLHWHREGFAAGLGLSALHGSYDPRAQLDYLMLGADLLLRIRRLRVRAEYLLRRQKMSLGARPEEGFAYGPGADGTFDPYFVKDGFCVEAELPVGDWRLIARFDGLGRVGNVPVTNPLDARSRVLRYTAATAWRPALRLRLKASAEYYTFSDFRPEFALHLGLVTTF